MEQLKDYVKFLRALGSEERLNILEAIEKEGPLTVTDVEKRFFMEQSTASHHLNMMKRSNILSSKKCGRFVYYEANNGHLSDFYKNLVKTLTEKTEQKIQETKK